MPNTKRPPVPTREERREAFARRLHQMLLARNMRASDLARASGLGRDSISGYLNARSIPTPGNAAALAKALGVTVQSLLGGEADERSSAEPASPAFHVSEVKGKPGRVRLQMDREISFSTLVKITALLEEESRAVGQMEQAC